MKDIDSTDLWAEIQKCLGANAERACLSPLLTLVKPIRVVTVIQQDTLVAPATTPCPPGSVDLSCSSAEDQRVDDLLKGVDERLAAHSRQRETAERKQLEELLAAVDERVRAAAGEAKADATPHVDRPPLDSLLARLEAIVGRLEACTTADSARVWDLGHGLLAPSPTRPAPPVTAPDRSFTEDRTPVDATHRGSASAPAAAERPESANGSPPVAGPGVAAAPPAIPPRSHLSTPADDAGPKRVGAPSSRPTLSPPWAPIVLILVAALFFALGVLVHAAPGGSSRAADPELSGAVARPGARPVAALDDPESARTSGLAAPAGRRDAAKRTQPLVDSDGDGLYDPDQPSLSAAATDLCPYTPGPPERRGCPEGAGDVDLPERLKTLDGVISGVNFDVDSATLQPDSTVILDRAVELLLDYPEISVEISGHTDSVGEYGHNVELSQARAETVRQYLVDRGVPADRLQAIGLGPDRPLVDNRSQAGRLRNRRIEFRII